MPREFLITKWINDCKQPCSYRFVKEYMKWIANTYKTSATKVRDTKGPATKVMGYKVRERKGVSTSTKTSPRSRIQKVQQLKVQNKKHPATKCMEYKTSSRKTSGRDILLQNIRDRKGTPATKHSAQVALPQVADGGGGGRVGGWSGERSFLYNNYPLHSTKRLWAM